MGEKSANALARSTTAKTDRIRRLKEECHFNTGCSNSLKIKSNPNIPGEGHFIVAPKGWPDFDGLPMEKEQESNSSDRSDELEEVAQLLDPHLSHKVDIKKPAGTERWPVLTALTFIFGTSLLIWALVIALIYYLF